MQDSDCLEHYPAGGNSEEERKDEETESWRWPQVSQAPTRVKDATQMLSVVVAKVGFVYWAISENIV